MGTKELPGLALPAEARFEAAYFDANSLVPISHGTKDASFQRLLNTASKEKVGLFCPEVAVAEWVQIRVESVGDELARLSSAAG